MYTNYALLRYHKREKYFQSADGWRRRYLATPPIVDALFWAGVYARHEASSQCHMPRAAPMMHALLYARYC